MVSRFIYLGICGLFLAGIIHICIVLLIPSFGSRDAARQISQNTEPYKFKRINATSGISIANSDPFFKYSVCPFNLTEAALQVNGENMPDFWSVAVFDEGGQVIYSLNDRTAINKALRVIVVNSIQMADLRQVQADELETSVVVEAPVQTGFVLLRALVRDPSLEERGEEFLQKASCSPFSTR
ncbi:MAG: hypothetical protein AAGF54_08450 [Pseudomonadota bacterium]